MVRTVGKLSTIYQWYMPLVNDTIYVRYGTDPDLNVARIPVTVSTLVTPALHNQNMIRLTT